jgi:hypothetical protein
MCECERERAKKEMEEGKSRVTGRKKDGGVGERQGQESRNKNVERGGHREAKEMDRE